jgi:biotin operon repressor
MTATNPVVVPGAERGELPQRGEDVDEKKLWFHHRNDRGQMTRLSTPERVPDWLLGGRVRRRVFEGLVQPDGCNAAELAEEIGASDSTVYEVIRALRDIGAIEKVARGRYRLADQSRLAKALRSLIAASGEFADRPVSRPPGRIKP